MISLLTRQHGKDPRKTFQDMERKKIGLDSERVYLMWADCERKIDPTHADLLLKKVVDQILFL